MSKKEQMAQEYANWRHKEVEEYLGQKCDPKDMYYRNGDIMGAFEAGWDACLKCLNGKLNDNEILEKIAERLKQSKPMPAEFSKIIDEEFWNLV